MTKLTIRRRTSKEWMTFVLAISPFFLSLFLQLLRFPSITKYSLDLLWCLLLALTLMGSRLVLPRCVASLAKLILAMFVYSLIVYLFHFQSVFYYLWGFRNSFRLYVAFIAFLMYLRISDVKVLLKMMDTLFWINAVVTFAQFFVFGLRQDYLGGIFGTEKGCNAYSLVFFGVIISRTLILYMNGTQKALPCFSRCAVSLVIAAMAELKAYFLFFALILLVATLFTKFSLRKFWMILMAAVLITVGTSLLTTIFGSKETLNLDRIISLITAQNYSGSEDLGRFTAIPTISQRILTEIPEKLFGLGLGNCDTSAFAICNTPFFQRYSYLHYTWFTSACLFLELGFVGLSLNLLFFVLNFFNVRKMMHNGSASVELCQMSMIMSVLCIILTFYNSCLRAEVGYIAYLTMALPYIRKE